MSETRTKNASPNVKKSILLSDFNVSLFSSNLLEAKKTGKTDRGDTPMVLEVIVILS